jgi:hypothetical protein
VAQQVAGANRRWRWPFRYRGSRPESAVAQLSTLGGITFSDMKFPYRKFEDTDLWKTIDIALAELEENRDFHLTTARRYVVGYLCQQLARKKHVTDDSIVKRDV